MTVILSKTVNQDLETFVFSGTGIKSTLADQTRFKTSVVEMDEDRSTCNKYLQESMANSGRGWNLHRDSNVVHSRVFSRQAARNTR
jgi:hypothetical protein